METMNIKDKCAVVGVGWTQITRESGRTLLSLAVEACKNALDDAGLQPSDIDSIRTNNSWMQDAVGPQDVAACLGMNNLRFFSEHGRAPGTIITQQIGEAAAMIVTGLAHNVIIFRSQNDRSGVYRPGLGEARGLATDLAQFMIPFGYLSPIHFAALFARRHMIQYGTTKEQLGEICITFRKHAMLNERALFRKPISMEDYLNSPVYAEPISLLDICPEVDGAFAYVISSSERAKSLKRRPVYIMAADNFCDPTAESSRRTGLVNWRGYDLASDASERYAMDLFRMAGITINDIDVAEFYDAFSYCVITLLEGYGFCKKGEGGPFVEGGRIGLGGELPVNTHGGHLSEGYFHGAGQLVEAVIQLRGEAGPRQVKDAEIALVAGSGVTSSSAVILRR